MISKDDWAVICALSLFIGLIIFGTLVYSYIESWSLTESLYFTVSTLLTVGYGDTGLSPEDRLFTSFFIIICTTTALACIAVIGNWIMSKIQNRSANHRIRNEAARIHAAMEKIGHTVDEEFHESISKIGNEASESMKKI